MKTISSTLIVFGLATLTVVAQIEKGTWMLGGGLTASAESGGDSDSKTTYSRFSPGISYFVGKGFSVGVTLDRMSSKDKDGSNETTIKGTGFGSNFRAYAPTGEGRFAFYFQGGFDYTPIKVEYDYSSGTFESKSSLTQIYLKPGITFLINRHWSVELGFAGITHQTFDPDKDAEDDKQKTLIVGLSTLYGTSGMTFQGGYSSSILSFLIPASLGFRYSFGRKPESEVKD
jgi:long-subunit fatty acid transport protein